MKELNGIELKESILKFSNWLDKYGELSYDLNDFNSSKAGNFVRKVYYKNKLLGAPFAVLTLVQDTFFPRLRKLYAKPHREAIGDAQYALGYLNLYIKTKDEKYLKRGEHFLEVLKESAIPGYSGMCWGYTYGWQTTDGYWPPQTPVLTVTPYCFWAFKKYYEITKKEETLNILKSIADFASKDLKKLDLPNGTHCYSYSTVDSRYVINSNGYLAALLLDAYSLLKIEEYKQVADTCIEFILSYQEEDGKWYYEPVGDRDRFVDNFHTCFVLKALHKCYKITNRQDILDAVKKGYDYYKKNLINPDNTPKHFAIQKHNKLRKYEMYDFAEGIKVAAMLDEDVEGSLDLGVKLASILIRKFQLKDGHFVTRVTSLNTKHTMPFHRWPQAQIFNALNLLLLKFD